MAEHLLSSLSMLTEFFAAEHIEAAARRTGFVQRASKITGKIFLALVTFGVWSDAKTTFAQLAAKATQLDEPVAVSPEAIYQRMHTPTVCASVASRNLLLYQSLPSSIPYRYAILWRRKDDPAVGTTASGTVA